jgi:hypothetical protein
MRAARTESDPVDDEGADGRSRHQPDGQQRHPDLGRSGGPYTDERRTPQPTDTLQPGNGTQIRQPLPR